MDILFKSPLYLIATNKYIVPNIPILFGKFPGDDNYALIKNIFLFMIISIITYYIFSSYNKKLADSLTSDEEKNNITNFKTSLSDTVTVMFVVLSLYFAISMFLPVQLIKIEYDTVFNSIFFILAFAVVSLIYLFISNNIKFIKNPNYIKISIFSLGIIILFILYIVFDSQLSGNIPGINLIPSQIKKLINIAIKVDGADPQFLQDLKNNLITNSSIEASDFDKLMRLKDIAYSSMPSFAKSVLDKFKTRSKLLDKLLGPIDLENINQMSNIIDNPVIKIMLSIME